MPKRPIKRDFILTEDIFANFHSYTSVKLELFVNLSVELTYAERQLRIRT